MRRGLISVEQLHSQLSHRDPALRLFAVGLCKPEDEPKASKEMVLHASQKFCNLWHLSSILAARPRGMPSKDQFDEFVHRHNLAKDHLTVFFDRSIYLASRAWYTFKYFGFDNTLVLDGGYTKWVAKQPHFSQNPPKAHIQVDKEDLPFRMVSNRDVQELASLAEQGRTADLAKFELLDVRGAADFKKEHIPGFRNEEFAKLLNEDMTFKSDPELRKALSSVRLSNTIVSSCMTGKMACGTALALY